MKLSNVYAALGYILWIYTIFLETNMTLAETRFMSFIAVLLLAIYYAIKEGLE